MSLRIPTFSEIMAVSKGRGQNSDAPNLWSGLVGWWPLQEGGGAKAFDASGYGNHGTLTNMDPATDWTVTEKGRALDFDGVNNFVQATIPGATPLSAMTVLGWFKVTTALSTKSFFAKHNIASISSADYDWMIYLTTNSTNLALYIANSFGTKDNVSAPGLTLIGSWHHAAGIFDGDWLYLYLDGELIASKNTGLTNVRQTEAYDVGIGKGWSGYCKSLTSNMLVFHNRAFTPSEIQQLYSDPWAMGRLRRKVYAAAVAGIPPLLVNGGLVNAGLVNGGLVAA